MDNSQRNNSSNRKRAITPAESVNSEQSTTNPDNPDYVMKRQRNNAAVNKTRQKKRKEEVETSKRVQELREENASLERFRFWLLKRIFVFMMPICFKIKKR